MKRWSRIGPTYCGGWSLPRASHGATMVRRRRSQKQRSATHSRSAYKYKKEMWTGGRGEGDKSKW